MKVQVEMEEVDKVRLSSVLLAMGRRLILNFRKVLSQRRKALNPVLF